MRGFENKAGGRILVRGVNWLGDAVMSTPALLRLREARPEARISLLTLDKLADLWKGHPAVDEVIPFEKGAGAGTISGKLREGQFDLALVLPNSFRSALEAWLAGIPLRAGHGGGGRGWLLNRVIPRRAGEARMRKRSAAEVRALAGSGKARETFPPEAHHIHQYLHLVAALGASREPLPPLVDVTAAEVEAFRGKWDLADEGRIVGLNPGAEYGPAKRWPWERFVQTAVEVSEKVNASWLLFGGKGDVETTARIESALRERSPGTRLRNLAGRTSLRELCAGLSLCEVVLTNDTGPMHLAAAVGTSVVVPFGSTSPELTGPGWSDAERHSPILGRAGCAPCFLRECPIDFRCMQSIQPGEVAAELLRLIHQAPSHRGSSPK